MRGGVFDAYDVMQAVEKEVEVNQEDFTQPTLSEVMQKVRDEAMDRLIRDLPRRVTKFLDERFEKLFFEAMGVDRWGGWERDRESQMKDMIEDVINTRLLPDVKARLERLSVSKPQMERLKKIYRERYMDVLAHSARAQAESDAAATVKEIVSGTYIPPEEVPALIEKLVAQLEEIHDG